MEKAMTIVNYFLALQDAEGAGDCITNLKMQKLLYYAQGYYLAATGKPLFAEEIEAWQHGPIVPVIYRQLKSYGSMPIPQDPRFDVETLSDAIKDHLNEIWSLFGQFSAWKLRDMTHSEMPYIAAFKANNHVISHDSLAAFFSKYVTAEV